jgi:multiple sugar transport system substrate-binding protein
MQRRVYLVVGSSLAFVLILGYLVYKRSVMQPLTIRVIGEAVATVDAIDKNKDDFTRETGIRVVVEKYEYESALEKATLDLTSRSGTYDIILQYGLALGRFAEQNSIYTLDELKKLSGITPDFESGLFQNVWHELSWYKSKCYGYPFAANTMYVWYRKDLLEDPAHQSAFRQKYGYAPRAPQNWKEYHDLAEFFTRPKEDLYGTALQGKRHPALWYEWSNFAFSFGGGVMDKEHGWQYGPIIINSPQTIAGTEFYKSLEQYSPPGTTGFTWDDVLAEMQQGRIFMCIMWSDSVYSVEDPQSSKVVGRVGYAPLPVGPAGPMSQIAGGSYFVSRYSRHPADAFRFVTWCMKRESQIKQQLNGGASCLRSTYDDPRIQRIPYTKAYTESMDVARYMTDTIPETSQISDTIELALSDMLTNKRTVKDALDWAAISLNKLLDDRCPLKYPPQSKSSTQ